MKEKFTEKEYQDIVKLSTKWLVIDSSLGEVVEYASKIRGCEAMSLVWKALAIANPETRELAHNLYVEEEEKYYWITKKLGDSGKPLTLMHGAGGVVQMMCPLELLTRTEVVEWGFNPDSYIYTSDKEEATRLAMGFNKL